MQRRLNEVFSGGIGARPPGHPKSTYQPGCFAWAGVLSWSSGVARRLVLPDSDGRLALPGARPPLPDSLSLLSVLSAPLPSCPPPPCMSVFLLFLCLAHLPTLCVSPSCSKPELSSSQTVSSVAAQCRTCRSCPPPPNPCRLPRCADAQLQLPQAVRPTFARVPAGADLPARDCRCALLIC